MIELKAALFTLLLVSRFAAPLGNTRFSAPEPVGATPPAQLLPILQLAFWAPVQVNVCAALGAAKPPSASTTRRKVPKRVRIDTPLSASHVPVLARAHVVLKW